MKNLSTDGDWVNLPPFNPEPLTGRLASWSHWSKSLTPSGASAVARLRVLLQSEGLVGSDLLAAFMARRVLPLQGRPHLICQMSGCHDPSRLCTKEMPRREVANLVNHIAHCEFTED